MRAFFTAHREKRVDSMKISEDYMIADINGETAAIPVGQKVIDMGGALKLNEAASCILAGIGENLSLPDIKARLHQKYEAADDSEKAIIDTDVDSFIKAAMEKGVIIE